MQVSRFKTSSWRTLTPSAVTALALLTYAGEVRAVDVTDPDPGDEVTFARDVAPILQQNCQVCHSPGSIAPMSLMTYDEVKPWAGVIKMRVASRRMPPFGIDSDIGIQHFKNDVRLSDEEIATIVAWVEAGAPQGNAADTPAPASFPDGNEWRFAEQLGPPDLVVQTTPYTVGAAGEDSWWRPTVPTNVDRPRWIRAIETKPAYPAGRAVTHHVLSTLVQEEAGGEFRTAGPTQNTGGLLTEWAVGKVGEIYPDDTGKLLLPGSQIRFEVHYNPAGEEVVEDQVSLGIWFYPEGYTPKYRTILRIFNVADTENLEVGPNEIATHQNFYVMSQPTRLESFQPHMHLRGKGMMMEAIYPNGRREVLSSVTKAFDFRWMVNYIYDEQSAPLLPVGTVLVFTSWHDNTAANPTNPDPRQFVTWGDRAADEMAHAWVGVTYLEQADFDRQVAEREATTGQPATFKSRR